MKTTTVLLLIVIFFQQNLSAQTTAVSEDPTVKLEDLKALDYPELQVVPRASERLAIESASIKDKGMLSLFPYLASSVMTLSSGVVVNGGLRSDLSPKDKEDAQVASKLAMGIGAAGIGLVYWYTSTDSYGTTLAQVRGLKGKDKRTELLRERLSEEAFEKSANTISQWKWVFAAVNLAASAQLTGKVAGDANMIPTLSTAAALLPLFITTSFETNYQKQLEYKRRIYVPLTWFDYGYNPLQASWQPQMNLVWRF